MAGRRSFVALALFAALLTSACSPLDQAAATKDAGTARPALQVALCDDEAVTAVELSPYAEREDGTVETAAPLWRIEATTPSTATRFVVGETPAGFVEAVPLSELPDGDLSLNVTTEGGYRSFHGEVFDPQQLQAGVLINGDVTSLARLNRNAEENCSFLGLVLPGWAGWTAAGLAMLVVGGLIALAVRKTRREPELASRP